MPQQSLYVVLYAGQHYVYFTADMQTFQEFALPRIDGSHALAESICTGDDAPFLVMPGSIESEQTALTWISVNRAQNWTLFQQNQPASPLQQCAYGNGMFVGVSMENGESAAEPHIYTSGNGSVWTLTTTLSPWYIGLRFVNGYFVLLGRAGSLAYSADAVAWNNVTLCESALASVDYGNGVFVVVGEDGVVLFATDLSSNSWTQVVTPVFSSLYNVVWNVKLNRFVVVGGGGAIVLAQIP